MTEPVDMKKLGGLSYNANLVSSAKKLKNGKFEIIFKTGEKLVYPQQEDFKPGHGMAFSYDLDKYVPAAETGEALDISKVDRQATIFQSNHGGLMYDNTYFDIRNVMGATFTSSKDTVSHVELNNSSNTTIDLSANNSKWFGDKARVKGGANNKVILDKEDTAIINGHYIDGQGTAAQKDYYSKF